MIKSLFSKVKNIFSEAHTFNPPAYRVADIIRNDKGEYNAVIQLVGKREIFEMKPEEILANDKITELFHPHDVRLLTYLGYCGINTPQYKILAKKILANEGIEIAIYDNKKEKISVKNVQDIPTNDHEVIHNMEAQDAYDLGFAHGRNSILEEKRNLNKFKN